METARPTRQQMEWQDMELAMFVHLSPAAWQGTEIDERTTPLSEMKLEKLNTDQWCEAALSWGAKMIVFVAKHGGGFCWWQTDTTDYSVKSIPWKNGKGDLLEDISRSCEKYGLKLGIYLNPMEPDWNAGLGGKTEDPALQEAYAKVYRQQLTEVLSKYGTITEIWFDGSCVIDVSDVLETYAKDAVIFQSPRATIRWCGTERGILPMNAWAALKKEDLESGEATVAQGDPDGDAYAPLEVDTPIYDHYWFWSKEKEQKRKSLEELIRTYYHSVGRGGQLLLNASPTSDGNICDGDMERYKEFGQELQRRFGSMGFEEDHPQLEKNGSDLVWMHTFSGKKMWNHMVLMEDISGGERIREFTVEYRSGEEWKPLWSGKHLGHKKILVFNDQEMDAVRVRITDWRETPGLRKAAMNLVECSDLQKLIDAQRQGVYCYDPSIDQWITIND